MANFTWGQGGQIVTPEQAKRQRAIAEALIGQAATPGANWGQGLADVAAALSGSVLQQQAGEAEAAGYEQAGGLFGGLSSQSPETDIIAALNNPWATPQQQGVAQALLGQQMEAADPYRQLQIAQAQLNYDQDLAGEGTTSETFFGTPVPFQNADGSISFAQLGNQGTTRPIQLPEGASPAPTTRQVDTGTEIITMDIYGNELFRTPKDIAGAAREKAVGEAEGAGIAGAPGDIATGEAALDIIEQIKTHPDLAAATGFTAPLNQIALGTGRYDFQNLVEQAKSGAFLTAIQEMRGLGSLSNAEGQTATAAITRMNTALSKTDFLKAVADYEAIIRRGIERAKSKLPEGTTVTPLNPTANGGGTTAAGVSWSIVN